MGRTLAQTKSIQSNVTISFWVYLNPTFLVFALLWNTCMVIKQHFLFIIIGSAQIVQRALSDLGSAVILQCRENNGKPKQGTSHRLVSCVVGGKARRRQEQPRGCIPLPAYGLGNHIPGGRPGCMEGWSHVHTPHEVIQYCKRLIKGNQISLLGRPL